MILRSARGDTIHLEINIAIAYYRQNEVYMVRQYRHCRGMAGDNSMFEALSIRLLEHIVGIWAVASLCRHIGSWAAKFMWMDLAICSGL